MYKAGDGHWEICTEPFNSEEMPLYWLTSASEGAWSDVYLASDGNLYRNTTSVHQWERFNKPELSTVREF